MQLYIDTIKRGTREIFEGGGVLTREPSLCNIVIISY